jgi:hypothetical protein
MFGYLFYALSMLCVVYVSFQALLTSNLLLGVLACLLTALSSLVYVGRSRVAFVLNGALIFISVLYMSGVGIQAMMLGVGFLSCGYGAAKGRPDMSRPLNEKTNTISKWLHSPNKWLRYTLILLKLAASIFGVSIALLAFSESISTTQNNFFMMSAAFLLSVIYGLGIVGLWRAFKIRYMQYLSLFYLLDLQISVFPKVATHVSFSQFAINMSIQVLFGLLLVVQFSSFYNQYQLTVNDKGSE